MLLIQQALLNLFRRTLTYLGIVCDYDLLNIRTECATVVHMMLVMIIVR